MGNPYQTPIEAAIEVPAAVQGSKVERKPLSLYFLFLLFSLTVVLALINVHQEATGGEAGGLSLFFIDCMIAGFSGLSQMPGLFIAGWRWKGSSNSLLPMLWAAYIIAFTGVGAFTVFALQSGPSDSVNSAAHMHIFFFPAIHLVLTSLLYLIALLVSVAFVTYSRRVFRKADVTREGRALASGDANAS